MGDTNLDISASFGKVVKFFVKRRLIDLRVFVHERFASHLGLDLVVVRAELESGSKLHSSATAPNLYEALSKAVIELGELIVVEESNLGSRNGIAGGLFFRQAVIRAKAELAERDAFLFHFRESVPFKRRLDTGTERFVVFEMKSKLTYLPAAIAIPKEFLLGKIPCIPIGLGSHTDLSTAVLKAQSELVTLLHRHELDPSWCREPQFDQKKPGLLPDFHHFCSRDPRIHSQILKLCNAHADHLQRTPTEEHTWAVKTFSSPICGVKYVQCKNSELSPLTFGSPEAGFSPPLYHPIW